MTRFLRMLLGRGDARPTPYAGASDAGHRLRRNLVLGVGLVTILVLGGAVWGGLQVAKRILGDRAAGRLRDTAARGALVVQRALLERQREIELIGSTPVVVDAVRDGAARAAQGGLVGRPIQELEREFKETRTLGVSARTRTFLIDRLGPLGIAEVLVTDRNGFNAVITELTSDFVQSDEEWWQKAFKDGITPAEASFDESAGKIVISLAAAVRDGSRGRPEGAIKIAFDVKSLDDALANANTDGVNLDVLDAAGRVVASAGDTPRMKVLGGASTVLGAPSGSVLRYADGEEGQIAATAPGNAGAWQIVAHESDGMILAPLRAARTAIVVAVAGLAGFVVLLLWMVSRFIERRISAPVTQLATVAEAVAGGDLSVRVTPSSANDEIGRLSRATAQMTDDLRQLVIALRDSAEETAARSTEINAGSDQLAGAAQQVAATSSELSQQAAEMAATIHDMSDDAARLGQIATELAQGAHEGLQRNATLRSLARENKQRFDASAAQLEALAVDAKASADAVAAVAAASEEFRTFVTLVRKMAKQSKLLALNAAMEAARAGQQGRGFAVVAGEVRRLAASSSEAADKTEKLVADIVHRIEQSRDRSARTVETVNGVLRTTQMGRESFSHVETASAESETWTQAIDRAASSASELVKEITTRVDALAHGTEAYAAAMQEVAASSQEQSASTEEIAAAARVLADAAERLSALISTFRLEGTGMHAVATQDFPTRGTGVDLGRLVPA
jgi:methyl-accepting chemotaxis protein